MSRHQTYITYNIKKRPFINNPQPPNILCIYKTKPVVKVGKIQQRILLIRGEKVIVDADLAEFYGVPTKALNQAVRRNMDRFPADFMFQLNKNEKTEVVTNCDHLSKLKFSPVNPLVFTEHGALMAASILNSARAVDLHFVALDERTVSAAGLEQERQLIDG